MKKRKLTTMATMIVSATFVSMLPTTVQAQDINVDVPAAERAMRGGKYQEAQTLLQRVIDTYADRAKDQYGGKFGYVYYLKGRVEMKIGAKKQANSVEFYNKAKESFANCRKFPTDARGKNKHFNRALIYMGQAEQALDRFQEAILHYEQFLKDKKPTDKYNVGMMNINMAICHFGLETPKLDEGVVFYETALQNKVKFRLPDAAILSAFKDFAAATIRQKKEQMLIDFIEKNRAEIALEPHKMLQFIPFFQKYAAEAFSKGMLKGAFTLYTLTPGTMEVLDDLAARKASLVGYKQAYVADKYMNPNDRVRVEKIRRDYDRVSNLVKSGEPQELLAIRSLAYAYESEGYTRGAYITYQMLERQYKQSKYRKENLFNLVRTSSLLGDVSSTEKYGRRLIKLFPESENKGQVQSMMLLSLFYSGEYAAALKLATELLPELKENSKTHDLCLHVYGGSLYYTGKYFEAHEHIVKHVKMYPKSEYKIAARYFEGSNLLRRQQWALAAPKLDKFLEDYPNLNENAYLPFAFYDRANCHLAEKQYKEAIEKLAHIEKEFSGSAIEAGAMNLRADVHRAEDDKEAAKTYYLKGLEIATQRNSKIASAESLYKLVTLLGKEKEGKKPNPNIKEAVPYYDQFWKNCQDSPYKRQVAVSGMAALMAAGRGDEAIKNLQGVITEMAKKKEAPRLESTINTYGKYYLQSGKTPEELKNQFQEFPGIDTKNKRARALLRIATIGVYEGLESQALKDKNEALASKYAATIKVMFKDMDASFDLNDLEDSIIVRLANFISKTNNSRAALKYYDKIIERGSAEFLTKALFGRAGILAKSNDRAEQVAAKKVLERVKTDKNSDKKTKGSATYQLVEFYNRQKDWNAVIKEAREYKEARYKKKQKNVAYMLAVAFDKLGKKKEAIYAYNGIYHSYRSEWAISVPALTRAAELTREVGTPDAKGKQPKQISYEMAARFIRGSAQAHKKNLTKMSQEEINDYEKLKALVQKWEKKGDIKTLKQIDKERGL